MNRNKKRGVSLIVLVITIIVIIILAGIVILNLSQNNTTDKAKEAVFKSDVANFKSDLGMYHVNELGKTMADYNGKLLDGDKATLTYDNEALQGKTMLDAIPLMKQKLQYTEKFIIFEGKLVYVGNNPKEIEWSDDLDIPSTSKSPVAIIELPNPAEVESGTQVTYTIRFSSGNKLSNFKKENIKLVTEDKQSTENNITVGEMSGTENEKAVEITIDTTNLEAGKYMLQVTSGTITDELTGLTNKEVYSESFTVDNTAPGVPEILVEPTSITNGNVTVTINYSEDSLTKQYKIGTGNWQDYTSSFTIEENVDIIARAINKVSTQTMGEVLAIRNIDKQAPTITLTTTSTTTSSITIKATATDIGTAGLDTNSYEYSKDDGVTWTTPSSNTTYTFENLTTGTYKLKSRVKDKATNVGVSSTLTELTKGMDTLGNITIVPSTTAPTNQNIMVTINYPTGIEIKQYKIGTGAWQNYTGVLTITENTDILAKGMDAGGNVLEIADALAIRNIDKVNPNAANISVSSTGDKITGTISISDNTGGSGIDFTNSKYVINTTSTTYEATASIWSTATIITTSPKSINEIKVNGTYYVHVLVIDKAGNKVVSKSSSGIVVSNTGITDPGWDSGKGVNAPALAQGMTPIKWNGTDWINTTSNDPEWYNYANKQWANAKTADGSFWVWIPRYEYRIPNPHTSEAQEILINFKGGTSTTTTSGYILHPGFTFGEDELTGIWVAKFEATAREGVANTESGDNLTTKNVKIEPNVSSWKYITISNMFDVARKMETDATYGWGTSGNGIDTHLMKNVEWGAVAYLSHSKYGKNAEVWINPNSSYKTGQAGDSVSANYTTTTNAYNTTNGQQASTTGNIYGVYDMSGGAYEYTAAYVNNGNAYLKTYGAIVINAESKYKDIYQMGSSDKQSLNYEANSNKKGDAVYETSSSYRGTTSWYSDSSLMPYSSDPFFMRGGNANGGANAGVFFFDDTVGNANYIDGFRVVLGVGSVL